jgi:tetratricopeptide (TPR) repeat protein
MALPLLESAAAAEPKNPTYQYHVGMAYEKVHRIEEAISHLKRALQMNPNAANAEQIRAALESAKKT